MKTVRVRWFFRDGVYRARRPALTLPITDAEPEAPIASTVKFGSRLKAARNWLAKDCGGLGGLGFTVAWNITQRGLCEG